MKERVVIQEAYGLSTLQGMIRFIERVLWGTFLVEGIGAIGYSFQFIPEYGVAKGIFYSVFHSISAFCNAGVAILGDSSFTRYVNTPVITITRFCKGYMVFPPQYWLGRNARRAKNNLRKCLPTHTAKLGAHSLDGSKNIRPAPRFPWLLSQKAPFF